MSTNSGSNGSSSGTSGSSSSNRDDADQQDRRPDEPSPDQNGNGITKEGPGYKVDGNKDSEESVTPETGWYADADADANADQNSATAEASAGAGWRTDEFDSFQVGVEARAGATVDQGETIGINSAEIGADAELKAEAGNNVFGVSASASAGVGVDRSGLINEGEIGGGASIGADVAVRGGNAQKNGNEVAVSVGAGFGVGGALIVGDDIDGDGQKEYGIEFGAKLGIGGAISLRFEPDAIVDRAKEVTIDWFGLGKEQVHKVEKEAPKADVGSFVDRLESALEMPRIKEASARLESLLPI